MEGVHYVTSHPAFYLMLVCLTFGAILVLFSIGETLYQGYKIYKDN